MVFVRTLPRARWLFSASALVSLTLQVPALSARAQQTPAAARANTPPATQTDPTPAQTPQEQAAAQQHAQAVQNLINRAQASYQSGVNNYNTNNLDAARHDFDSAVDMMLSSGLDLKSDPAALRRLRASPRLHQLARDRRPQAGQRLLAQGRSSARSKKPKRGHLRSRPRAVGRVAAQVKTTKSDLPLVVNDYVAGFISYFSNSRSGHAHLVRSLERAGKYKDMIAKDLADDGVPQDLIYIAVAESGFQPQVVNRSSGAGGMWQFMPFQGAYGLDAQRLLRRALRPRESLRRLRQVHEVPLRAVRRLVSRHGRLRLGSRQHPARRQRTGYADFWELYRRNALPRETRNYVPGMIAAAIMAKNPQQYGLTNLVPDAPVLSDTVTTDYAIDLKLVADLTNSTVAEIVALNPALLRLSTPRDIPYDLHLPAGTKQTYLTRLKDIPEEDRTTWRFHVVKPGETLDTIADTFHARLESVAEYNDVTSAKPIEVGDELVIPISAANAHPGQQRYTVRRGDSSSPSPIASASPSNNCVSGTTPVDSHPVAASTSPSRCASLRPCERAAAVLIPALPPRRTAHGHNTHTASSLARSAHSHTSSVHTSSHASGAASHHAAAHVSASLAPKRHR